MEASTPTRLPSQLNPIPPASPCRMAAEGFIAGAYLDKHGARVLEFLPELVGLQSPAGEMRAVAGYRPAGTGRLFLEQYLAQPVEQALSDRMGTTVSRDQIAEVGNLAGASCRYARQLVSLLPRFLLDHGYAWVVFTATSVVRDILSSVGAGLVELAPADANRLGAGAQVWGRYYHHDPRVMAGYLPTGINLSARWRHRR